MGRDRRTSGPKRRRARRPEADDSRQGEVAARLRQRRLQPRPRPPPSRQAEEVSAIVIGKKSKAREERAAYAKMSRPSQPPNTWRSLSVKGSTDNRLLERAADSVAVQVYACAVYFQHLTDDRMASAGRRENRPRTSWTGYSVSGTIHHDHLTDRVAWLDTCGARFVIRRDNQKDNPQVAAAKRIGGAVGWVRADDDAAMARQTFRQPPSATDTRPARACRKRSTSRGRSCACSQPASRDSVQADDVGPRERSAR